MMPRLALLAVLALLVVTPLFAEVTLAGGDGSSFEKAILVQGATEPTGVAAEYAYLDKHYPGYAVTKQSLLNHKDRLYDALDFTWEGKPHRIYFDITEFFGK
ncbi:hypothetical protein TSACC_23219 [Terrimicrobium sacchariphilum]|uniref:Uncharacterized protein n=1 Tax=Terrimicrobium sacchariphilum TaxID=690879 RepID=A0A146GB01_TERSA|nr:hypothetical protein [Terrimicrobium sacchariphilum]GAT34785.1 hypothetical protein TSACC_23219 [Terrimicrobium sacchariphilum]